MRRARAGTIARLPPQVRRGTPNSASRRRLRGGSSRAPPSAHRRRATTLRTRALARPRARRGDARAATRKRRRVIGHERHDVNRLGWAEKPRWTGKSPWPRQPDIGRKRRDFGNRALGQVAFDGRLAIDVCLAKSCREPVYKRAEIRFGLLVAEPLCTRL